MAVTLPYYAQCLSFQSKLGYVKLAEMYPYCLQKVQLKKSSFWHYIFTATLNDFERRNDRRRALSLRQLSFLF